MQVLRKVRSCVSVGEKSSTLNARVAFYGETSGLNDVTAIIDP